MVRCRKGLHPCAESLATNVFVPVEEVAKLLNVTREEDPGMLAYVAIGLFAGLRRSELCALEWSEIDVEAGTIEVKVERAVGKWRARLPANTNCDPANAIPSGKSNPPRFRGLLNILPLEERRAQGARDRHILEDTSLPLNP